MARSLVSNPPYNMRWKQPMLSGMMPQYGGFPMPPESNANFAFVLNGLYLADDKIVLLLPNGVMTPAKTEKTILSILVQANLLEAVIMLPNGMFESTSIPVCILVFNKHKDTAETIMIDLRQRYEEETRDQNGQFGGASHVGRTYHKTVKIVSDAVIDQCVDAITHHKSTAGFSQAATIEDIKAQDFCISPSQYVKSEPIGVRHRAYQDIAADYNRSVRMKNAVRITFNRTAAKRLGLDPSLYENDIDISPSFKLVGCDAEKDNFVHFSANDGIRIECSTKDGDIPIMISDFIRSWTQYIRTLNSEANRYLAEFRDALLPDLMSGKIEAEEGRLN